MAKNAKIPGWPDMLQPPFAGLTPGFGSGKGEQAAAPGLAGGMDFMKGLWGGLPSSLPGFVLPTLDIKELDKRIEDLRSVESWLALNANMLKATIQGLEVQRNTLAALQALREKGDFLSAMMKPAVDAAAAMQHEAPELKSSESSAAAEVPSAAGPVNSKAAFAEVFRQSFGAGAGNPNWPLPLDPVAAAEPIAEQAPPPDRVPRKAKKSIHKKGNRSRAKAVRGVAAPAGAGGATSGAAQSANLWMNFLKDQFGQLASAALAAPAAASEKGSALGARPAANKTSKVATKRAPRSRPATAKKAAPRRPPTGSRG